MLQRFIREVEGALLLALLSRKQITEAQYIRAAALLERK